MAPHAQLLSKTRRITNQCAPRVPLSEHLVKLQAISQVHSRAAPKRHPLSRAEAVPAACTPWPPEHLETTNIQSCQYPER